MLGPVTTLMAEVAVVDALLLAVVLGPVTILVVKVTVVDTLEVFVVVGLPVLVAMVICDGAGDGCTDGQLPDEGNEGQVSTSAILPPYCSYLE